MSKAEVTSDAASGSIAAAAEKNPHSEVGFDDVVFQ